MNEYKNLTEQQLKQIKYHLIGTITEDNKKVVNKTLRQIDRKVKEIKNDNRTRIF